MRCVHCIDAFADEFEYAPSLYRLSQGGVSDKHRARFEATDYSALVTIFGGGQASPATLTVLDEDKRNAVSADLNRK